VNIVQETYQGKSYAWQMNSREISIFNYHSYYTYLKSTSTYHNSTLSRALWLKENVIYFIIKEDVMIMIKYS
jgi:hypothetical protein